MCTQFLVEFIGPLFYITAIHFDTLFPIETLHKCHFTIVFSVIQCKCHATIFEIQKLNIYFNWFTCPRIQTKWEIRVSANDSAAGIYIELIEFHVLRTIIADNNGHVIPQIALFYKTINLFNYYFYVFTRTYFFFRNI